MANYWYAFVGGPTGDPRQSGDYSRLSQKPTCFTGNAVCAIYVPGGDITPDAPLSQRILTYLADAAGSSLAQPVMPPMAKKYVYKRDT